MLGTSCVSSKALDDEGLFDSINVHR